MTFFETGAELANAMKPTFFCGLDLAQSADYSALVILERRGFSPQNYSFDCRHIHRWQLRTGYPQIVADTVRWMNSEAVNKGVLSRPTLAVDATGCGAPVIDLLKAEKLHARLVPILITGGDSTTRDGDTFRVPKRDLVAGVSIALQNGRLKYSDKLALTATLIAELQNFKAKISTAGHDSYGAGAEWRVGNHDDLVLSLALALWCANDGAKGGTFWSFE